MKTYDDCKSCRECIEVCQWDGASGEVVGRLSEAEWPWPQYTPSDDEILRVAYGALLAEIRGPFVKLGRMLQK